ncbi:YodC family protein [Roseateles sp. PN1]|uniref:YodC family protein n=1 Tax=Roseateles sp. PN1 TaxID=3137372 RepID=UPI00313A4784
MNKKFEIGDVISLNSETKTMTVTGYSNSPESMVQCEWFDHLGTRHQGNFHEATVYKRMG